MKRVSVQDIRSRKGGEPIVVLTAYTAPVARIVDNHADIILVGDSLGMVVYGMPNTLGVTIDMMIAHGKAVVSSTEKANILIDMPFGSYQESKEQAFRNAARILVETGCAAVKLEGGVEMAETVRFLVERGIPVMGHVGLKPQHFNALGGFRYQGRTDSEKQAILHDSKMIEEAGAYALLVEGVAVDVADEITRIASVPTIGIGASPNCDGQVLVIDDMLGLSSYVPKFVKKFADARELIDNAAAEYAIAVKSRKFPEAENCYGQVKREKA